MKSNLLSNFHAISRQKEDDYTRLDITCTKLERFVAKFIGILYNSMGLKIIEQKRMSYLNKF